MTFEQALRDAEVGQLFSVGQQLAELRVFAPTLAAAAWADFVAWQVYEELQRRGEVPATGDTDAPPRLEPEVLSLDEVVGITALLRNLRDEETATEPLIAAIIEGFRVDLDRRAADAAVADALADAADAEARAMIRSLQPPPNVKGIEPWSKVSEKP